MRARNKVAIVVGVVVVVGLGLTATMTIRGGTLSLSCGSVTVRVRGRLADATTGAPIAGAWLMTLPDRSWADEPETIANYRKWNTEDQEELSKARANRHAPSPRMSASLCASTTTDENGEFEALVEVPWSWREVNGVPQGPRSPPPRHGVRAIRIEPKGNAPVVVEVEGGSWDADKNKFDETWATWDLGTLRVPGTR